LGVEKKESAAHKAARVKAEQAPEWAGNLSQLTKTYQFPMFSESSREKAVKTLAKRKREMKETWDGPEVAVVITLVRAGTREVPPLYRVTMKVQGKHSVCLEYMEAWGLNAIMEHLLSH